MSLRVPTVSGPFAGSPSRSPRVEIDALLRAYRELPSAAFAEWLAELGAAKVRAAVLADDELRKRSPSCSGPCSYTPDWDLLCERCSRRARVAQEEAP